MDETNDPVREDLWWVQFPGQNKRRPAVIVSPDVRNKEGENVIIAGCTTQTSDFVYDDEVLLDGLNLEEPIKVQCDYLYTIKQAMLSEKITRLLDVHMEELDQALLVAAGVK